ncbi:TOC132 protein [Hibiscus syriacus]|uniref:TOC132 protein n=1 Tax=Hibiscus syriacus TaxID=106335 RepID=A0A6A2WJE3_HIBSY|nr:TOC132 protein [Hibiscus syriacus]
MFAIDGASRRRTTAGTSQTTPKCSPFHHLPEITLTRPKNTHKPRSSLYLSKNMQLRRPLGFPTLPRQRSVLGIGSGSLGRVPVVTGLEYSGSGLVLGLVVFEATLVKMENGGAMVDGSITGDNKIWEERVANMKVDVGVVGDFGEIKGREDEDFEETIVTQVNLQELAEKSVLDDNGLVANAIGNFQESIEVLTSAGPEARRGGRPPRAQGWSVGFPSGTLHNSIRALKMSGPALVLTEVRAQENVIPSEVGTQADVAELVVEQKEKELLSGESVGGGVVLDKIDVGGTEMGAKTDELNGSEEVPEIRSTGKTDVLRDEEKGNLKSDTVTEMPVKGDTDMAHLEGTLADEKLDTLESDRVEEDVKSESNLEVLNQEGKGEESREDVMATNYQEQKVLESADTSAGMIFKLQDDKVSETVNDKSANVDMGDKGTESRELKGATSDLDSLDGVDENEKAGDTYAAEEVEDNMNGEAKDSSVARDIKHNGEIDELKNMMSELSKSVEGTVDSASGNLSSTEKSTGERNEQIPAGKTDMRTELHDGFQSQLPDEMAQDIHFLTEKSENKAEKDHQDKQSTRVTLEQEVQHAPGSSLSSKTEEFRKKADIDQEPKPNTHVTRVREILPAPASSTPVKCTNPATPSHPAGLGRAAPLLEPSPRVVQQPRANGSVSQAHSQQIEDPGNVEAEESDETREKLQLIRVKFLRLANRLGQTPHNVVVAQVLYRLGLAEQLRGRNGGRVGAFSFDRASATLYNSGTKKVQDVVGTVHGIKVRVIDTPGLLPSWLDMQTRDFGDMPLLRTITEIFGPSIWFNAIVVLTHAASAPPDGPNGTASSYDMFVTQRSHVVQQAIRQAAGDMRLMNPVSLVENHAACRTNRADDDLDESSDSEEEPEYDELPPFKQLTKAQIAKLSKAQKKAYFDELEYREKLFMKKQLKEEKQRRKMMKKMAAAAKDLPSEYGENAEEENSGASSVPVPMPDLALPASFDSDNPTHRYRSLDSSNPWLVRPVLDTHGWDHDVGYEGINVERLLVAKDKFPISFSGQITKDKRDANVQMELTSSLKHGEGKATSVGFDMQTVGKDIAYTLRSDTRFSNLKKNKATAGISMTGGAMNGRGDLAYGGLEAQLRDKDYPLGRSLSTLGLSIMDWHGDLAMGCNIQSQVPIGRSTNLIARGNLNNKGAGQVGLRLNSSEQLQLALIALFPLLKKLFDFPHQMQYGQ